jgi:hypothetical protein
MSAFEICGMCSRQYDTAAAAHSCDHTPAKPSYPFEVFPWDDDVTNDNGWVGAKDAIAAYDALFAERDKVFKINSDLSNEIDALTILLKERDDKIIDLEHKLECEIEDTVINTMPREMYVSLEAKIESLKGIAKIMDIAKATIGIDPAQVAAEINENKQLNERLEKERAVNKILVEALKDALKNLTRVQWHGLGAEKFDIIDECRVTLEAHLAKVEAIKNSTIKI